MNEALRFSNKKMIVSGIFLIAISIAMLASVNLLRRGLTENPRKILEKSLGKYANKTDNPEAVLKELKET